MQVTTDTRTDWERMRRTDLWRLADVHNVPYPPGAAKDDMIKILSANQINPLDTKGSFEWDERVEQDENGRPVVIREPKRKAHATANKNIDYAGILDAKAQKEMEDERDSLQNEVAELKAMLAEFMSGKTKKIVEEVKEYSDMKMGELKSLAKERGFKIPIGKKKVEIIEILRNGEDTA